MLAIIGGTGVGLSTRAGLHLENEEIVDTRWGEALATRATLEEKPLLFLPRHADVRSGNRHVPPHRINYRANIAALKKLGATAIFASTAVGSLRAEWKPGTLVLLDQLVDSTTGRTKTFFDERAVHVDLTHPYCPQAREYLSAAAKRLGFFLETSGTYLCSDGPRFETAAEIAMYKTWGADVVGMTGCPEAALAREAEISYAGVSIVTNLAAGISAAPLTQSEVLDAMHEALPRVVDLFLAAAREYSPDDSWLSRDATREFATPDFDPQHFIF